MNITINTHINYFSFNGIKKVQKTNIDKDIIPILKRGGNFNDLVNQTGYSIRTILKWFKEKKGMSAAEYFNQQKQTALKKELIGLRKQGYTIKDIAKHFNHSYSWAHYNLLKFGIIYDRAERNAKMNEAMYERINNGDTVKTISEDLNCSYQKVSAWVQNNLENGIVKYRHDNDITLNHTHNNKNTIIKNQLTKIFAEGKSISDASILLNMPIRMIYRYKKIFGLKTKLDEAHEFMDKYMPDMIKAGWGIKKMANLIGLSETTVSRNYIKLTGFTYKELHKII